MSAFDYVLRLGDDALIASQRMAQWCASAPQIEEDVALANIALDLLGQARGLLSYAADLECAGRDEDALAFLRSEREFTNLLLVELPNGDFAKTIGKLLFASAYLYPLYEGLSSGTDAQLAGIAAKSVKEVAYHLDHALVWTLRLGDGTDESHRRMQQAIDDLWPYTHELFESDEVFRQADAHGAGIDPPALRDAWTSTVEDTLNRATLDHPSEDWIPSGGRHGLHTEGFGHMLAEMQFLQRAHPGAQW